MNAGEQRVGHGSTWTPGPWEVIEDHEISVDGESWAPSYIVSGWKILGNPAKPEMAIAVLDMGFPNTWDDDLNDANARLIAAAPDMFAALEALNGGARPVNWDDDDDPGQVDAWRQLDAALAKARGEA